MGVKGLKQEKSKSQFSRKWKLQDLLSVDKKDCFSSCKLFVLDDAPDKDILVPNNPNRCNCIIDRIFTGGLQSDVTCQACK